LGVPQKGISEEALQYLQDYPWYGNIRELENFVKYILSSVDSDIVGVNEIPGHFKEEDSNAKSLMPPSSHHEEHKFLEKISPLTTSESPFAGYSWRELESDYVTYLLEKNKWNVTRAAHDARINRSTFDSRMKRLGISNR
jgi:DNA-binding NtrC family response regulator